MIRYLIKNNMKLMTRSFINIMVLVICPLMVSAILTSAFTALMEKYEGSDGFKVGYKITGNVQDGFEDSIITMGDKSGIQFVKYTNEAPEDLLKNSDISCFVDFSEDTYKIYEKEDCQTEGKILEGAMSLYFDISSNYKLLINSQEDLVNVEKADFIPAVDSKDYYGIIEIVYFAWCAIVCAAGLLTNEKKYGIRNKFVISGISEVKIYLARLISLGAIVTVGVSLSAIASVLLFDVHWGNVLLSAIIVIFMVMASCAFGLMIYTITDSMVLTVIITFIIVWIAGYIGGSFETYMFSSTSQSVKELSPIYHENRALVEILLMGKSDYFISAVLYSLGICTGCSAIAVIAGKLRARLA
ncbi:MAG: ABC transporter permease [Lachnospiraceae bacterium]|nr:ABC transporter permease [Lachnospiraceae bacterium]